MKNHTLEATPGSKDWTGFKDAFHAKPKSTYSWYLYKHGTDWAFNSWEYQKFDELLTCGTEKALDYWYWKLSKEFPNYQSEMWCTISTEPIENATCILELIGEHPDKDNSHDYFEPISGEKCWLCEFGTQLGLGGADKLYLYLTLEP
tara:strand:+ start:307 stop:747 length:441 start_codon:yes stop_codon:yes gene_type:complete